MPGALMRRGANPRMAVMAPLLLARLMLAVRLTDGSDFSDVTSTSFRAAHRGEVPCCGVYLGLFRDDAAIKVPSALVLATASEPAVNVTGLAPATAYTLRWRSRETTVVNFDWGWGNWSAPFVCTTAARAATADGAPAVPALVSPPPLVPEQARTVRMYRVSEFSLDVDFLSNHSSGDAGGEAVLLSAFVHKAGSPGDLVLKQSCLYALTAACPGLRDTGAPCLACTSAHLPMAACGAEQPSVNFSGRGRNDDAHFFCGASAWIDPRHLVHSPSTRSTTYRRPRRSAACRTKSTALAHSFGPYLSSCDAPEYGFKKTPLHPLCNCQVSIDRMISKLDQNVRILTTLRYS